MQSCRTVWCGSFIIPHSGRFASPSLRNSRSYHIELLDRPAIYWDFHSLLLGIQMMFSFILMDSDQPLRLCKSCQKVFLGSCANAVFAAHGIKISIISTKASLKRKEKINERRTIIDENIKA